MPETADLSDTVLQQLAAEIVRDIYPLPMVLDRFQIKPEIFNQRVKPSPRFRTILAEAAINWDSSMNAKARIRVKGEVMVEQMLLKAHDLYNDAAQPLAAKVQLLQTISRITGLYDPPAHATPIIGDNVGKPSDRVNITINLHPAAPGDHAKVVIDQPLPMLPISDPLDK